MNIGYVFDEGFTIPAAVSMYSIMYNNRHMRDIRFYILDDGIHEKSRKKLEQMVHHFKREIVFIDVSSVKKRLSETTTYNWNGSYSTYIRLMLNSLIPEDVDRITMIDGDTVIEGKLDYLAALDMEDCALAMALESAPESYHRYSGLGNHDLYNGGLLVVDLKKWKECDAEGKILSFLTNVREKNMLTDEDVLSAVFKGKVKRIPPRFNYLTQYYLYASKFYYRLFGWDKLNSEGAFYSLEELRDARKNTVMYHCIDTFTNRPWFSNNIHPYKLLYEKYYSRTPWRNTIKPKRKMNLLTSMEYHLRKVLPKNLSRLTYAVSVKLYYGIGAKKYYRT